MINTTGHLSCNKCGSTNVEVYVALKDIPKPKTINMAEWQNEPQVYTVNAVMTYCEEIAECKDCGYKVSRWR